MQRRQILQTVGGLMASAAMRPMHARATAQESRAPSNDVTGRLARYMAASRTRELPSEVILAAKHRILDTLGAIVKDAQGLSYDLGSLNTQITALFQLSSAPNGMSALKQRLADIRSTMVQSYIYALRTQTLIKTTQNTIRHLKNLVSDIDIMLGNKEGHQTTAQVDSALNKTLATLQAQTSAFERAESVERLGDAVAVESLIRIHQAIMEDYPKQ